MKTRNLTIPAIFMALGLVLHFLIPPIFFGVKPDFLLSMMFISLMIVDNYKEATLVGVSGAVMSALTTNFPGGQIPNFIEKIIVALIIFKICQLMKDSYTVFKVVFIFAIGTLLSGSLFLLLALSMTKQMNLFLPTFPVVLIAMLVNSLFGILLFSAYKKINLKK